MRIQSLLSPKSATALVALFAIHQAPASAQSIYVGGLDTLFMQGDPVAGNFQFLGACGGSIQSMTESHHDLFLGDVGGRVYQFFGQFNHPNAGATTYVFDSPNDATALADYGGTLLVGGSDHSVHSIDKSDGSVLTSFDAGVPVGAMLRVGRTLYVGSPNLDVIQIDLLTGGSSLLGTCGGEIQSMALDGTHLALGTPSGIVYRMQLSDGLVDAAFGVNNDATALVMDDGDLLVGGSDGTILRVDPVSGLQLGTLSSLGSDVSAMAMAPEVAEPGWPYCYGIDCPCDNDDPLSGCTNSTGVGARMFGSGTNSFLDDDMVLTIEDMPSNSWAVNYMGALTNNVSFGDGKLCTGNGYPVFRFPIQNAGQGGVISLGPGIVAHSQANFGALGQITPGSTWLYQIWYRNPPGPCNSGFNTSNGYVVTFAP